MDIYPMSDKMKAELEAGPKTRGKEKKYPWLKLNVGESFPVEMTALKYNSLVAMAHKAGKRHGRVYKVTIHEENGKYEVGLVRIEPVVGSSNE